MINLLPTELKEARKYGRLNLLIAKQLLGIVMIGVFAVAVMLSGLQLTKKDLQFYEDSIAIKDKSYGDVKAYEEQANKLQAKVSNIKKLFEREVLFSKLLVNIASAIPVGAQLTDLSLTGTSTEPLAISAKVNSQDLAGVLRRNLVDSGIFESADLESVTQQTNTDGQLPTYTVSISASLTGSAEKVRKKAAAEAAAAEAAKAAEQQATSGDKKTQ